MSETLPVPFDADRDEPPDREIENITMQPAHVTRFGCHVLQNRDNPSEQIVTDTTAADIYDNYDHA